MVPFFVGGALEGGFGGWVVPQGCPPQKVNVPSKKNGLRHLTCFAASFLLASQSLLKVPILTCKPGVYRYHNL